MCNSRLFDIHGITWIVAVIIANDISQWFKMLPVEKEREREIKRARERNIGLRSIPHIARLNPYSPLARERVTLTRTYNTHARVQIRPFLASTHLLRCVVVSPRRGCTRQLVPLTSSYLSAVRAVASRSLAISRPPNRPGSRSSSMGRDWSRAWYPVRAFHRSPPRDPGRIDMRNRIEYIGIIMSSVSPLSFSLTLFLSLSLRIISVAIWKRNK